MLLYNKSELVSSLGKMSRTSTKSVSQNVELDEYGCLSLAEIIKCFNAPISEEHAWALIYQCLRALDNCIRDNLIRQPGNLGLEIKQSQSNDGRPLLDVQQHQILSVLTNEEILIQEDGIIHHNTWCSCNNHNSNRPRPKQNYKSRRKGKHDIIKISSYGYLDGASARLLSFL